LPDKIPCRQNPSSHVLCPLLAGRGLGYSSNRLAFIRACETEPEFTALT
jgi:hypothetical protein